MVLIIRDCLVVVGYRFNSEDNHINSVIADWLENSNGKLLYLNYNNAVDFNLFPWARAIQTRNCNGILCDIQRTKESIININVTSSKAQTVFGEVLDFPGTT